MPSDFYPTHLPNGGCNLTIAEILDLISAKFKEHVKFQDESDADALALWAVMTYVMEHLEIALHRRSLALIFQYQLRSSKLVILFL